MAGAGASIGGGTAVADAAIYEFGSKIKNPGPSNFFCDSFDKNCKHTKVIMMMMVTQYFSLAQLTLTEHSFDRYLREVPVALVAFVAPWCGRRCKQLAPELQRLSAAYEDSGIAVGLVSSEQRELLDRYSVDAFPSLLWFDGSQKWPYYASEATPERYKGARAYEDLASFIEARTGIAARIAPASNSNSEDEGGSSAAAPSSDGEQGVHSLELNDACKALSKSYTACMRHRRDRQHRCAAERHEYLLCMSGRWTIHPDHHQALAAHYRHYSDQ